MKLPFRQWHILQVLENFDQERGPLDRYLHLYFRENRSIGSHDRREISETVYGMFRWAGLLEALGTDEDDSWEGLLDFYLSGEWKESCSNRSLPAHIRTSFPENLYGLIENFYGPEKSLDICFSSNEPAPLTVRVNTLKISREQLLERWKKIYEVYPTVQSPYGITFQTKAQLFSLPEFQEGLFEVQDEGSQLLANLVEVLPGQHVLDFCAGAGGKSLAIAPRLAKRGQIYLHDIRPVALQEAKKRLRRAGVENSQTLLDGNPALGKLRKKMDWVLVDAPCSGTGTLRRNPDMKWRFSEEMLRELCGSQRMIFERALSYLKPGGRIVYATCSILNEENSKQIEHFCKTYHLEVCETLATLPQPQGMDGFFGAVLKSKI